MLFLARNGHPFEEDFLKFIQAPEASFSILGVNPEVVLVDLLLCGFLAWLLNQFIDVSGHRLMGTIVRRSWRTHAFFMAPFWGAAIPLAIVAVPSWVLGVGFPEERSIVLWIMATGALIALEHLWLDSFTPDGFYYTKTKKINFARVGYTNRLANYFLISLGLFYLVLSFIFPAKVPFWKVPISASLSIFDVIMIASVMLFFVVMGIANKESIKAEQARKEEMQRSSVASEK